MRHAHNLVACSSALLFGRRAKRAVGPTECLPLAGCTAARIMMPAEERGGICERRVSGPSWRVPPWRRWGSSRHGRRLRTRTTCASPATRPAIGPVYEVGLIGGTCLRSTQREPLALYPLWFPDADPRLSRQQRASAARGQSSPIPSRSSGFSTTSSRAARPHPTPLCQCEASAQPFPHSQSRSPCCSPGRTPA